MADLTKIERLISAKRDIEQQEKELIVLTDIQQVSKIKSWFDEIICSHSFPKPGTVQYRQLFIFIIFLLYSPKSLFRYKMPRGLRREIATSLNVRNGQIISDNSANVRFLYTTYADFRDQADYLYSEILFRLEIDKQYLDERK